MKNVALTNCWCSFADGWDEVIKEEDGLTAIIEVRKSDYKRKYGCMSKTKATEAALFDERMKKSYFLPFLVGFSGSAAGTSSLSGVG